MNYSDINNKKSELTSESLSGNCISSEEMTGTSSNISDLFQREKINFEPCKPSTWPEAKKYDDAFKNNLKRIFYETVINEIDNVIDDSKKINGNLNQRGHVIAVAQLCAVDNFSSYAFFNSKPDECKECGDKDNVAPKYKQFISSFFPEPYKNNSKEIYKLYRCSMVHGWNLFQSAIYPGSEEFKKNSSEISYGLLNFQKTLKEATENFFNKIQC
jgi:hypothetical protein